MQPEEQSSSGKHSGMEEPQRVSQEELMQTINNFTKITKDLKNNWKKNKELQRKEKNYIQTQINNIY